MKHLFTLLLALSFGFTMNAEINYTNYGEGWVIPINANQALDINDDGQVDLYANRYSNELGLSAVFAVGCINSPSESSYVSFGARELSIFEFGEIIQGTESNVFDYIDDGRGSAYHSNEGYAEGFESAKEYYLGFMLIQGSTMANGWMKVIMDDEGQAMIIKEIAYGDYVDLGGPGIMAGETGLSVGLNDLSNDLTDINIAPNPAQDFFNVNFEYASSSSLKVDVYNSVGQMVNEVSVATGAGTYKLTVNTSDWSTGVYYVRFQSNEGVRTERVSIR